MIENTHNNLTSERASELTGFLDSGAMQNASIMLNNLHPAEIADLLESLPATQRNILWGMVHQSLEGDVLVEVGDGIRHTLISNMDKSDLVAALENMQTDDMADIVLSLPETVLEETLNSLDKQRLNRLQSVLSYAEDTAGGLMDLDFIAIRPDVSVEVVQRYLRQLGAIPDNTDNLFVVDRHNHYLGIVPIGQILVNEPNTMIQQIIEHHDEAIDLELDIHEVARLFEDRNWITAPVIDADNILKGRITIDDVVDVIREEGEKSMLSMAGLNEDEDIFSPILKSTRQRALWLGLNLVTAFIAAGVIGIFEATIAEVVILAVLLPIVASMGGIAGSQTLTLVIRAQALGQIGTSNVRPLFIKEIVISVLNGILWAVVVSLAVYLWFKQIDIAIIIAIALLINLAAGAAAGVIIPLVLRRIKIDPALAGGVILTTVTDVIGFIAFLGIATMILM